MSDDVESATHFIAETMWPRDRSTWVRLLEARDRLMLAKGRREGLWKAIAVCRSVEADASPAELAEEFKSMADEEPSK